jgi:hypothetical protein
MTPSFATNGSPNVNKGDFFGKDWQEQIRRTVDFTIGFARVPFADYLGAIT